MFTGIHGSEIPAICGLQWKKESLTHYISLIAVGCAGELYGSAIPSAGVPLGILGGSVGIAVGGTVTGFATQLLTPFLSVRQCTGQSTKILNVGQSTKILNAPKILNPFLLWENELEKLAAAILSAPNGINALGVVIDFSSRLTCTDAEMLAQLLQFPEVIPYTFVVFSHAKRLAEGDIQQECIIREMLSDAECPTILSTLLKEINHRYILLESAKSTGMTYHYGKTGELMQIVQSILEGNKKPLTFFITDMAKKLQEKHINLKEGIVAVKHDLKILQNHAQEEKQKAGESAKCFWKKFSIWIATSMGASVAAPICESLDLSTLGDSALADLVTDVSAIDTSSTDSSDENKICVIQ